MSVAAPASSGAFGSRKTWAARGWPVIVGVLVCTAVLVGSLSSSARADATFPFHPCHSRWMSSAGSAWGTSDTSWTLNPGPPANFIVSMTPKSLARNVGIWSDVWRDLTKCVKFPSNLPHSEIDSLQKQMDCHIYWSTTSLFPDGGKTWDFEGWRPDVSLAFVVSPAQFIDKNKHCNWGPVTGPPMPSTTGGSGSSNPGGSSGAGSSGGGGGGAAGGGGGGSPGSSSVSLAQGPAAPQGYRYAVTLNGFAANSTVSITCYDSVSTGGFYTFSLSTDGSGNASTASYCYSGDGPEHWVVAGGVESNHVSWGGGSSAPPPPPSQTWSEQETPNHPVNTFTDYDNASGMGPAIAAGQWVEVSCKVYDPTIASVNPDGYWYRIASAPWSNAYYSPANTFMNGDPYGGPYTHNTDFAVPDC
jgi:uncharacterized membrane protein YgcG